MSIKFSTRALSTNLPLCRWQLYEDLVCDAKYGPVDRVWLSPGHVYITIKGGTQLYTFDTKPTSKTHEENRGCLDLNDLDPPVLDILLSSSNYNLVYVVQRNGHVQCWKFRGDLTWMIVRRFDLCNVSRSDVTSICLHSSQGTLYWCERRPTVSENITNYCVCKQQITDDEDKLRAKEMASTRAILHNCPAAVVYPVSFGVAIVMTLRPPLVSSLVILWLPVTSKVVIYMGAHQVELSGYTTRQPISFLSLAVRLISYTVQMKPEHNITGVTYDPQSMEVTVIEGHNHIRRISDIQGLYKRCQRLHIPDMKDADGILTWFNFRGYLGAVYKSQIVLFDRDSGQLVQTLVSPDNTDIVDVCHSGPGTLWTTFFTMQDVYVIQQIKVDDQEGIEDMLMVNNFQTKAVELAYLEQLKSQNNGVPVYDRITKLGKTLESEGQRPPSTKLAEAINPYLKEYWSLEKFQQDILNGTLVLPSVCPGDIEEEVLRVLCPETCLPMAGRQAWLLLLADKCPEEVLEVLMKQLDFDTEDISSSQLQRWQCILAKDSVASPVSTKVAVPMFEHICRLLFLIQPSRLVNFVKIAQLINDQRVGVSAFIRKRQALQYYDRAIACLPALSNCQCVQDATTAYVQLLLASEEDECELKAVQTYMDQGCWANAVHLLSTYTDNSCLHVRLFHAVLLCMTQKGVIAQYANDLFKCIPLCKSFDSVMSAFPHQEKVDSGTHSVKLVFATGPDQVQIADVRPYLLDKVRRSDRGE